MFQHSGTYFFFALAALGFGFAFFRILYLVKKLKKEREEGRPRFPGRP
jgi:hypothetical protein